MSIFTSKIGWALLFVVVVACGAAVYYHQAYVNAMQNTPEGTAAQAQAIVAKVGQLIVLPQGETPTVATVIDPTALQGQPFFAQAQKGDLVLIYTGAQKAILYDPSINKIVEVAPLTIGNSAGAGASAQATVPTPTPAATTTSTSTTPSHK